MTRRRCEIATEAPYLGVHVAPACGKPATWASDDVARDGSTVWMCERHCRELMTAGVAQDAEEIRS